MGWAAEGCDIYGALSFGVVGTWHLVIHINHYQMQGTYQPNDIALWISYPFTTHLMISALPCIIYFHTIHIYLPGEYIMYMYH